ncbi:Nif3-like dinuclear metal center hexameric protein [Luteolibacter ambystomatis]|uniref:Nif3-like dinuclear metal center hexameric protein n=1 Tax=Luteolibacter ambystomatis TaxID=2824561 RepID=A0A975G6E1_9BACT|nr:Nif3-like dinuclear metal center hexameric protein [Luteolibacter ambystomatis]QUE50179.1 Nif3-like dinuclear metal center hexameric protein [Luteolibacter ambystomatis]
MDLATLTGFLDSELRIGEIADYSGAVNGLQLENSGEVPRLIAAVDASLPVIEAAAAGGPGLLLVHHGMFWQGAQPVRGAFYRKLKTAMDAGLAIYSAHLPLDVHPEWGNNVLLARAIGLQSPEPFLDWKGRPMGLRGAWEGTRGQLVEATAAAVGGSVHLCPGGREHISNVGLVTGGAGSEVAAAAASGIDAFITGEGPHWSYPLAEELGLNVLYAGHYATETFGVKALAQELSQRFGLPWEFVDRPTGL